MAYIEIKQVGEEKKNQPFIMHKANIMKIMYKQLLQLTFKINRKKICFLHFFTN